MELPTTPAINLLTYLLPGFVAAGVMYMLTPATRVSPFERVVQALIYTIVVQALVVLVEVPLVFLGRRCCVIGTWTENASLVWSVLLAVAVGLLTAWADNTDRVHSLLRNRGITFQTSFPSEWFGALSQHKGYVVLHLVGQRRLYGWPFEWPNSPTEGHFVMAEAEWLTDADPIKLQGVDRVIVPARDVEMVELMQIQIAKEDTNGRPEGTDTTA